MEIQHNMLANFTQRELKLSMGDKSKSTEKLASGYRINRSADDAAGLSISEKMRSQIRGLERASKNISDGVSFIQVGEGALGEVHDMLGRIRELAIQASNDTYTDEERKMIDDEIQTIKKETKKIFNDTEFNTIPIFRAPYIPEVEGEPEDFKIFNIGSGGADKGGVLINNKRYTWDELKVETGNTNWSNEIHDPDSPNELIKLKLDANEPVENIYRVYELNADSNGIRVNNLPAAKWSESTGGEWADADVVRRNGTEYSFTYRGMEISFETEPDDEIDDVISHLAPGQLDVISWNAKPSGVTVSSTLVSSSDSMTLYVTNDNKNNIEKWSYQVVADNTGVELVQYGAGSDKINHKLVKWEEFTNTIPGEKAYPIADWGTENEYNNPISIDADAVYNYTDVSSPLMPNNLNFDFSAMIDEVGKQDFKTALTQMLSGGAVSATLAGVTSDSSSVRISNYAGIDFHYQRDALGRDFDNTSAMRATVARTANVVGTVTDDDTDDTYNLIRYSYAMSNSDGAKIMEANGSHIFVDTDKGTYDEETGNTYIEINGTTYLTKNSAETVRLTDITDDNSNASVTLRYDNGAASASANNDSVSVGFVPDGRATRSFYKADIKDGKSQHTTLDITVNAPEKLLHIQAGSLGHQSIDLRWPALTNTIIGIGSTNTRTYDAAQGAIRQCDHAIDYISSVRSSFGAYQNRLEYAYAIDRNTAENTQSAESKLRDTDMADEMVRFSKHNILEQVGQSMLSQANNSTQGVLSLIG